jgi:hypothetical protein
MYSWEEGGGEGRVYEVRHSRYWPFSPALSPEYWGEGGPCSNALNGALNRETSVKRFEAYFPAGAAAPAG